ncbi:MAG: aldo/keto reductase [Bacteroidota bacterium]
MPKSNFFSRIIAGTMTWGSWGKALSTTQMSTLIQESIDLGITTFDHADIYGNYGTEGAFGKALAQSKVSRSKIQLITKCGIQMVNERQNQVKHYQYDAEYIIWSAERSLKALQTEYLDLFLLHRPSPLMEAAEIATAVDTLKAQGKIRAFGVSNFTPSQIALLETLIPISGNQVEFSLSHTDPMYDGTFDDCTMNERIAMAWSPLGGYFKSDESASKERLQPLLKQFAEKYEVNESQLLLAFILRHPVKIHPVVGTTNSKRLEESVQALSIALELQDWYLLLEASKGRRVP